LENLGGETLALLEIKKLVKYFGGLAAIQDLDMYVNQGEIVGLIGPNGAGKTTVFNLITGFLKPTKGQIMFEQTDITGQATHKVAEMGVARTFQGTNFLPDFTVLQNVCVSCYLHPKIGFWPAIFNTTSYRRKEEYALERAIEILQFFGLDCMKDDFPQNLPHGHQKLLTISMALSTNPKLLLLDEPVSGMSAAEVMEAATLINKTRSRGTTIVVVEHNMTAVMELCDRLIVLNFGRKIAEGLPEEIRENRYVIEAYLGVDEDATRP
jgi:branched-chain amino acid transport system ATP-binding protein